jgi:hypothetical protein
MSEIPPPFDSERPLAPPIILEAQAAFLRDLPQLLKERYGQWVAYHGAQRIGFGKTQTALWNDCLRQGYEDILIRRIWPIPESDLISAL